MAAKCSTENKKKKLWRRRGRVEQDLYINRNIQQQRCRPTTILKLVSTTNKKLNLDLTKQYLKLKLDCGNKAPMYGIEFHGSMESVEIVNEDTPCMLS